MIIIDNNDIELAFNNTCQCHNGYTLNECLKDINGGKADTIYSILEYLSTSGYYNDIPFGVILIHSDSGVKDFFITYKLGEFSILVYRFIWGQEKWDFDSVDGFVKWLSKIQKRILATATLELDL